MYILYCNIFLWKLIDRISFNQIFNTSVVSQGIPPFSLFPLLHVIISKQDIHICYIFHIYWTITLSSVLKPKYSLSTRNKCIYLLEAFKTSITPKIAIFRMCYGENSMVKFLETLPENVFRHNFSMVQIEKKLINGKISGLHRPTPLRYCKFTRDNLFQDLQNWFYW